MIERIRDYRITDEIGSGGMAVVYQGVQESLNRTVAIKALKTSMSGDENVVARFEREAFSVASFQHENIISLYDFFRERGGMFMVMEYVEGIDLYDLLDKQPLVPTDVVAIISLQIARALEYAHFRGVIHRDVKPANIILSKLGEVKLTDFGIARTEASDLTEAGIGLGTPAYMSPEQIVGDHLDHRSDIWSLGVVMYQMLTGSKPFVEDDQQSVMQRIRLEQPVPPRGLNSSVPRDLERIVTKCMQKSPKDRYDSTQDLVIALEQYLAIHVNENYRARMVVFLKEQEVISGDETLATLHPAMIGGSRYRPDGIRVKRRPGPLLPLLLLLLGVAGGAAGAIAYARWSGTAAPAGPPPEIDCSQLAPTPAKHGFLRVLAQPWAHVFIDGEQRDTTPHKPLPLSPGVHQVKLSNPYGFEAIEREVTIKPGKVLTLTEVLRRGGKSAARAGKARSSSR